MKKRWCVAIVRSEIRACAMSISAHSMVSPSFNSSATSAAAWLRTTALGTRIFAPRALKTLGEWANSTAMETNGSALLVGGMQTAPLCPLQPVTFARAQVKGLRLGHLAVTRLLSMRKKQRQIRT